MSLGRLADSVVRYQAELAQRKADQEHADRLRRRARSLEARRQALAPRVRLHPAFAGLPPSEAALRLAEAMQRKAARGDVAGAMELQAQLTLVLVDEELAHVRASLQAANARRRVLGPPEALERELAGRRRELAQRLGEGPLAQLDEAAAEAATWARAEGDLADSLRVAMACRARVEALLPRAGHVAGGQPDPDGLRALAVALQELDTSPAVEPPQAPQGAGARGRKLGWAGLAAAMAGADGALPAAALRELDGRLGALQADLAVRLRRAQEGAAGWQARARELVESLTRDPPAPMTRGA